MVMTPTLGSPPLLPRSVSFCVSLSLSAAGAADGTGAACLTAALVGHPLILQGLGRCSARGSALGHVDESGVVTLEGDRDGGRRAVAVLGHDEVGLTGAR